MALLSFFIESCMILQKHQIQDSEIEYIAKKPL